MKIDDDDFTLFGLAPRFALDPSELDGRWRALQAKVHPDRFVSEGTASQRLAMQWAVRVNQAYRRLKDPLQRGAYLCELRGQPINAESNTAMPPAFLMQQMAWREALEEAGGIDAVEALDAEVAGYQSVQIEALRRLLDEQQDTAAAAAQVRALMFVNRFRDDIHKRLEALDA